MKRIYNLILLFLLVSCTKDLELSYEKPDQTMVVNCLFSEEETWKVTLSRIKSYGDLSDSFVEDARIMVIPENKDTIHLEYLKDGIYVSDKKPTGSIQYRLVVRDSKGKTITAQSSVPAIPIVSDFKASAQSTLYYSNANLSDYSVLPLTFRISGNDQANFIRFRLFHFNTRYGYIRYLITIETISELRQKKRSEDFLAELEKRIGVGMSYYEYWGIIRAYNGIDITSKLKEIKVTTRYDECFKTGYLFSNSLELNSISKDIWNVLGEYSGTQEATLLLSDVPVLNKGSQTDFKEEYWLEVVGMSEDYYKYQKTFIKQVENKNNPFASAIEVYTNIDNGVGIFAGYNRQMIHLHDY